MSFSRILFEADQRGIALITVNRPEKLNALDRRTIGELNDAFESVESSHHLKGLILTGADGKAFVAGADLQEIAALLPSDAEQMSRLGQEIFRRLEVMRKPSVAAINGYALGGGWNWRCAAPYVSPSARPN